MAKSEHDAVKDNPKKTDQSSVQQFRWIVGFIGVLLIGNMIGGWVLHHHYATEQKLHIVLQRQQQEQHSEKQQNWTQQLLLLTQDKANIEQKLHTEIQYAQKELDIERRRTLAQQSLLLAMQNQTGQEPGALSLALQAILPLSSNLNELPVEAFQALFVSFEAAQVSTVLPHPKKVTVLTLDSEGHRLFTATKDQAWLWNADTGTLVASLTEENEKIEVAAFSSDNSLLITGGTSLRVFDAQTGRFLRKLADVNDDRTFNRMAVSPKNSQVAVATTYADLQTDPALQIFRIDQENSKPLLLHGHEGGILGMTFSKEGGQLLTGGQDGRVCLWNPQTGRSFHCSSSFFLSGPITSVGFSIDGQRVLAKPRYYEQIYSFDAKPAKGGEFSPKPVTPSEAELETLSTYENPSYSEEEPVWSTKSPWVQVLSSRKLFLTKLRISTNHKRVAIAEKNNDVRIFRLDIHRPEQRFEQKDIQRIGLSHNGKYILTGNFKLMVTLWDAQTGTSLWQEQHNQEINFVGFTPDDSAFMILLGGRVFLYSTTTQKLLWSQLDPDVGALTARASFCSESGQVVLGGTAGARLIDTKTGNAGPFLDIKEEVYTIACARNGGKVATNSRGIVKIWNVEGKLLHEWPLPNDLFLKTLAFSKDGKILAAGDVVGNLWLHQVEGNTGWVSLQPAHQDGLRDMAFVPAGDYGKPGEEVLMSVSRDSTIFIWHIGKTKLLVTMPIGERFHDHTIIYYAVLSSSGASILMVRNKENAEIHPIPTVVQIIKNACRLVLMRNPNFSICQS